MFATDLLPQIGKSLEMREKLHPAGVEPTTYGFGGRHSIQLSYGCVRARESLIPSQESRA
jgi:hypothetical protein